MAKNLFEVVQNLFIPFVLLSFVSAFTYHFNSEKIKGSFFKTFAGIFIFVLIISFLREKRLIKYNQIYNIRILIFSIIFGLVYTLLSFIYSRKSSKTLSNETKSSNKLELFIMGSGLLFTGCHMLYKVPIIFALPFHFVGMYDTYFSTMYLAKCTGYLAGWIVCILSSWAVYKILIHCSVKTNKFLFTLMYLISSFISFVGIIGLINSYYRRKIKIPNGLRKSLPQLITAENLIFFAFIIVLILLALHFFLYHRKIHGEYSNPAEHRKLKAFARKNRRWSSFTLLLCILVWTDMTVIKKLANRIVELSPSEEFQIEGNEIFIPLEQVSDGHLHRFTWTNDGGKGIRFIIVQKKGMSFGVGFDACDVCGDVGYYERKDEIVCNRCDVVMNKNTIGLKGGCNPVPLYSHIENGGIIILTEDLQKEAHRFKN